MNEKQFTGLSMVKGYSGNLEIHDKLDWISNIVIVFDYYLVLFIIYVNVFQASFASKARLFKGNVWVIWLQGVPATTTLSITWRPLTFSYSESHLMHTRRLFSRSWLADKSLCLKRKNLLLPGFLLDWV